MRFVILGGGPAGYAAAQAASALGADVTLVEDQGLGGNCNLTDAIPSKTLIATANVMAEIERAETLGVDFEHARPKVDLLRTVAHARWVAAHQSRGIRDRLEGTTHALIAGPGHVSEPGNVHVDTAGGRELDVPYDVLLVATGASPWEPPFCNVDHDRVFTTREVLDRRELPRHLLVVGAGATGCEYAEFFGSCGSRVTLLSARSQILPAEDPDVAEIVQEAFLARGIDLQFDARVSLVERTAEGVLRHHRRRPRLQRQPRDHLHGPAAEHGRARAGHDRRRAGRPRRHRRRRAPLLDGRATCTRPATSRAA